MSKAFAQQISLIKNNWQWVSFGTLFPFFSWFVPLEIGVNLLSELTLETAFWLFLFVFTSAINAVLSLRISGTKWGVIITSLFYGWLFWYGTGAIVWIKCGDAPTCELSDVFLFTLIGSIPALLAGLFASLFIGWVLREDARIQSVN